MAWKSQNESTNNYITLTLYSTMYFILNICSYSMPLFILSLIESLCTCKHNISTFILTVA